MALNSTQPKDLDIFVPSTFEISKFLDLLGPLGEAYEYIEGDRTPGDEDMDISILASLTVTIRGIGPMVNFVSVSSHLSPTQRFERFDFGACQIAWDGEAPTFLTTPAFQADVLHHRFTLLRCNNLEDLMCSMKRVARWRAGSYASWNVRIPWTTPLTIEARKARKPTPREIQPLDDAIPF